MTVFAKAGQPATTDKGKVVCFVKNDLHRNEVIKATDFHHFAVGETPWQTGHPFDLRCVRSDPMLLGVQICINGQWLPHIR
jgi:hypothetical protein